jgi:hypothetical protein
MTFVVGIRNVQFDLAWKRVAVADRSRSRSQRARATAGFDAVREREPTKTYSLSETAESELTYRLD